MTSSSSSTTHTCPWWGVAAPCSTSSSSRLPKNLRLFVAARWDPQLTLHQLRLAGRLVEIRGSDLAFDLAETRSLVESIAGVVLDDSTLARLDQRTDGWAAGIQLAAISIRRAPDVARFVEDFSGSDVLVADYLTREVLDSLDGTTRRFVMATSVLPWLSVDLCGVVVDDMSPSEIEAMLDDLEQQLIFMVPTGITRLSVPIPPSVRRSHPLRASTRRPGARAPPPTASSGAPGAARRRRRRRRAVPRAR